MEKPKEYKIMRRLKIKRKERNLCVEADARIYQNRKLHARLPVSLILQQVNGKYEFIYGEGIDYDYQRGAPIRAYVGLILIELRA